MLVVASEIDASTERILNYLSDTYGVDINAVSFQYFHHREHKEFLARVFLIEPSQVDYSARTKSTSKRRNRPSYEEFRQMAEDKGVGDVKLREEVAMTMETIEVKLNERTLARLRKMAAAQRLTIDAMLQDIIEHLSEVETSRSSVLGMFSQEPEVLDSVINDVMATRERDPLRQSIG
ncbi:MAG: hypothetical protein ACLFTI_10520 [Anaerolineales bacterium]